MKNSVPILCYLLKEYVQPAVKASLIKFSKFQYSLVLYSALCYKSDGELIN